MSEQTVSPELRDRLLKAWRGEITAGAMYELIARRLPPREAEIMRKMAAAEAGHRQRLEERMIQLGIEIPPVSSVKIGTWMRLQAKLAPVDRLLAAREAAEDEEVDDLYKRSTGDAATDKLLHDIRKEERSHSMAVTEMRDNGESKPAPDPALTPLQQRAKARLDKITGRETWHQASGGWISGAIYGANDGLASVFGIVAGVSGATAGSSFVLTAGAAGAIASALSMATGAFLAERSEAEVAEANLERERQEIVEHPEEEREELSLFYQLKGIDEATADAMAEQLSRQPDAMLRALAAEEFGVSSAGEHSDAAQAAIAAGISTGLGAMIPVIPFIFTHGTIAILISAGVSILAHFAVGAAKSLFTLRRWWAAGFEMTLAGIIVGGATFLVGLALPT
ncbi:MAG TPA: VIT1/CCC1 transporter family protein [Solirubrobacteraceae bacterium]|nr:VIT1/CCC1 transporter family protein [Solirubrobacteraceae bacterium]